MAIRMKFSKITMGTVSINEISTDGTMAGNSDLCVPTEKAVKTYVDARGKAGVAKGDIMYYDGAVWQVLTIGATGEVLKVGASGIPDWASA